MPELAVENGWLGFDGGYQPPLKNVASWPSGPESSYLNQELRVLIQDAISDLPEKYRIILLLRDVEHLTYDEISLTLGITVACVKSRLHRSRLSVRQKLDEYFKEKPHGSS